MLATPSGPIGAVPTTAPSAVNVTVPVGVAAPGAATAAVTVVLPPAVAGVAVTVVVVVVDTQAGSVKTLLSSVTAPTRARARPATVVPVPTLTEF
jgi:hypothetical protein